MHLEKQHVYIIGSKGIPAKYGGFETFVEKLTEYQNDVNLQYHIACTSENSLKSNITDKHFQYNGADCFNIDVPNIGPAKAIFYDIAALKYSIDLAKKNKDKNPIFYILACRIGPFISFYKQQIKKINGKLFVNPDGHEWLREKWSKPVRKYWKISERLMVKNSDLLICDSKNIENYILNDYRAFQPKTIYISYGTDTTKTEYDGETNLVKEWLSEKNIKENNYFLVVGRFVPENNYEVMITEFMKSDTKKDFVLITNVEENKFYNKLLNDTNFIEDKRIKFVGTVYDQNLLKYIRENAYGYFHGHEVGGTNPSLLEALSSTKLNLLLDVGFNKEVAENGALYWNKDQNNLKNLIENVDKTSIDIDKLDTISNSRILEYFNWENIVENYENLFRNN